MALPDGFLDELRNRLSLADVVGRKVVWDQRKSNRAKGDWWAPCPFHGERTASFHVLDRQGYYYCFGCHAKGDAISFVRETENVGFMEAVEILATEAGMTMPARDPDAARREEAKRGLSDVVEAAFRHYATLLNGAAAKDARGYLARRGLGEEAVRRFGLGFAPDARRGVIDALGKKGISEAEAIAAGLAAKPDGPGDAYDRFRDRIVFPIRDARGRAVSLAGRAMSNGAKAKYLNGPDTVLFDKGAILWNEANARDRARDGGPVVLAEGYMDVIALDLAGIATVAPMGTAVTEGQLRRLWRLADEPVVALDGDRAGLRAAERIVDLALPLLEAGRSLRFALMPDGKDPDDLIREKGPEAAKEALEGAIPLVEMLWRRETARPLDTPERRAAADKALREAIRRIPDPGLRRHYADAIQERRTAAFGSREAKARSGGFAPRGQGGGRGFGRGFRDAPRPVIPGPGRASALARGGEAEVEIREGLVLGVLLLHPGLLDAVEDRIEAHDFGPLWSRLASAVLQHAASPDLCAESIPGGALEALRARPHLREHPAIRAPGDAALALATLREEIGKLEAARVLAAEVAEAAEALEGLPGEGTDWRLGRAARAHDEARRAAAEDDTVYETAPNGVPLSRTEREAWAELERLLPGGARDGGE
ncbi:DNA primase [Hasllibacter halocynthiae]|uniref:DNA primase n=1 Tax=Hasllibacter halocynthiae TaxID=595589 RepID=A0A2T0X6Z3_9RHOB|nr:DNA primase [Hasllibacter halocynthiae]PRY94720.1 DNA primase [Hasllibacter halocynthiae]